MANDPSEYDDTDMTAEEFAQAEASGIPAWGENAATFVEPSLNRGSTTTRLQQPTSGPGEASQAPSGTEGYRSHPLVLLAGVGEAAKRWVEDIHDFPDIWADDIEVALIKATLALYPLSRMEGETCPECAPSWDWGKYR